MIPNNNKFLYDVVFIDAYQEKKSFPTGQQIRIKNNVTGFV